MPARFGPVGWSWEPEDVLLALFLGFLGTLAQYIILFVCLSVSPSFGPDLDARA